MNVQNTQDIETSNLQPQEITCFKAYDIRGELNVNLDEQIAYRVGRAFAEFLQAKTVVIGCDIRKSSEALKKATIAGIIDAGSDVIDLGMTGTEEVYFYTSHYQADGGIEVTASHNPINFNGLKLVRENSKPIGQNTGLADIRKLAEAGDFKTPAEKGKIHLKEDKTDLVTHLLSYIDLTVIKPIKVVINPGNGSAAPLIDLIEKRLQAHNTPIEFIKIHYQPDGDFPNGIPNPMIISNRKSTSDKVLEHNADIGIAFDGDFDRCFFFDEKGQFLDGYYVVGLLAQAFLESESEEVPKVVYDPRVIWNTEDIVAQNGGVAVMSPSGHSNIKQIMREQNAIYGGEMSAHHYFRDFNYCDSGMIPWLLVIELLSRTGKNLSELVAERIAAFPSSGEMNFKLSGITASEITERLTQFYESKSESFSVTSIDGVSLAFAEWRYNLRASNTEPLIRLNIETKNNQALLNAKIAEINEFLVKNGATPA